MYDEDDKAEYYAVAEQLSGALLIPGTADVHKVKRSLAVQRRLQMLSTSVLLPNIDAKYNLKTANMMKSFEERDFYAHWLDKNEGDEVEKAVWRLCKGISNLWGKILMDIGMATAR